MKKLSIFLVISGLLILSACSPTETAVAPEADIMKEGLMTEPAPSDAPADAQPATEVPDPSAAEPTSAEVSFSKDIYPVLEQFAFPSHSTVGNGGVFLETYEDVLNYVVPGKPEESMLYKRLTGDGVGIMPPGGKLPDETLRLFYDWIAQGAKDN